MLNNKNNAMTVTCCDQLLTCEQAWCKAVLFSQSTVSTGTPALNNCSVAQLFQLYHDWYKGQFSLAQSITTLSLKNVPLYIFE